MRALIIYDSQYGNTARVAEAIWTGIGGQGRVEPVDSCDLDALGDLDLLIVGSPTQGGRPTTKVQQFLSKLRAGALTEIHVAAFDTRFKASSHGLGLRLLMRVIGFAAPRISSALQAKGGSLIAPPEGFFVAAKDGPLEEGDYERAAQWGHDLLSRVNAASDVGSPTNT